MAAMSARRMTMDGDLSMVGVGNDEAVVAAVVAEIVATELDVDDGLLFDAGRHHPPKTPSYCA